MLYLIDKDFYRLGLALAERDRDAKLVFIQDGVYAAVAEMPEKIREVYAIKEDVERRAVGSRLSPKVRLIDYSDLVDLALTNKVVNLA